jgi:protein-disulfide isomerase
MKQFPALLLVSLSFVACNQASGAAVAAAATATPDQSATEVAAKIGSRSFSNAELDTRLKEDLATLKARAQASEEQLRAQLADIKVQVKEQEYNLRKKALTEVLFDMEAQARGITRDALIASEITAKSMVTSGDTDAIWEEVKSRAKGATKEQVLPQLNQMAAQRKTENRSAAYQRELFKKHNVALIGLQPSRKTVNFPSDAPVMGPADAPITIVEFTDYQCPYCQAAQQYVDRVMDTYKGQVRLVYQEFPLDFHPQAKPAGRAARCAGEQGKFWEMHTGLLRTPGSFDEADLQSRAKGLGIDANRFGACIASNRFDGVIQRSVDNGRAVGVSGTPTFFLNGRSFSGAQPFEVFERMIEEELSMTPSKNAGR